MNETEKKSGMSKDSRSIFIMGGAAALLSALGALADIGIGMSTGGSVSAVPHDAAGRFAELAANPPLGLYNLDLLNLITTLLMVPAFYACWLALRRDAPAAGLAFSLCILGAAVFVSNNPALSMLGLSRDYASADASRRALLTAAGEAILAKGAHGSPGVLAGFLLSSIAGLLLSVEMLRTRIFPRAAGILGLCGNILLGIYLMLVTFMPRVRDIALAVAAPGGLMAIAWMLVMAVRLLGLPSVASPRGEESGRGGERSPR